MAVVLGTNAGFVSTEPAADPADGVTVCDGYVQAIRHTSPSGANSVTKMGWWCDNATQEANFQLGLYSNDAAAEPDDPNVLLATSGDVAKGTTAGWKTGQVAYDLAASTLYWCAMQLDNTATTTNLNRASSGGVGVYQTLQTQLQDPFPAHTETLRIYSIWALYTAGGGVGAPVFGGSIFNGPIFGGAVA